MVEHPTEADNAYFPSVEILSITNVMGTDMKHGDAIRSVAQVGKQQTYIYIYILKMHILFRKTILGPMGSLVQLQ